jgi:hypothetical protein
MLGTAMPAVLIYMHNVPCHWEIRWSKIDLSDGYWRMIVQAGQMGWTNSPAYFCYVTEAGKEIARRLLALSIDDGLLPPHGLEHHCAPTAKTIPTQSHQPSNLLVLIKVFVDNYIKAAARHPVSSLAPT